MAQQAIPTGRMMYLHALSPVHAGTGASVDTIDLPIARERITHWPIIPGSSIKGVLKDAGQGRTDERLHRIAYGGETTPEQDQAGWVWFSDARLLCLPVRSLAGSFAWVTSPLVLRRWLQDHVASGVAVPTANVPTVDDSGIVLTELGERALVIGDDEGRRVYLEDLDLVPQTVNDASVLAAFIAGACFPDDLEWQRVFTSRFGVVHDDIFGFLAETATEVTARIRLKDDEKTVADGGLWYEESLPAESVLTCPIAIPAQGIRMAARTENADGAQLLLDVVRRSVERPVQIGGNASVGRGLVRITLAGDVE